MNCRNELPESGRMLSKDRELSVKTGNEFRVSIVPLRVKSIQAWPIQKLTSEESTNG